MWGGGGGRAGGGKGGWMLPSWAAETACSKAASVPVVGFWENVCVLHHSHLQHSVTPSPPTRGKAELRTAPELAVDEPGVAELGVVMVGEALMRMERPRLIWLLVVPPQ